MSTPLRLEGLLLACILLGVTSCRSLSASLSFQESVAQVFAEVHSSVVTLRTTSRGPSVETGGAFAELDGNGSGVLINADGDILTAAHVVQGADEIEAVFFDNRSIPARVISSDPISDIALVRLQGELPEGIRPARTGDSTTVHVGQQVFVVGAPLGISHTLTVGYVSALRLSPSLIDPQIGVEVIQTDAAINPGNSGGPLFDLEGRVVGIVSYISTRSGGSEGLGFAVSINTCTERFQRLPDFYSGLEYLPVRGRFAELLNLPPGTGGYLIQRVVEDSPAARVGLRGGDVPAVIAGMPMLLGGDILLAVDGIGLGAPGYRKRLMEHLGGLAPASVVELSVLRSGEQLQLRAPWGIASSGG